MHDVVAFVPIRLTTLRGNIVELLFEAILSGKIESGKRLNESELARQLQISRAPIREALHQLQEQGLVVNNPRRGMYVVSLSQNDVRKINRIRLLLEAEAMQLCKTNFNSQLEKQLTQMVQTMETMKPEPISQSARADLEFHRTIWNNSGNEHLARILTSLTAPLFAFAAESLIKGQRRRSALRHHRPFLEYLQGKSKQTADEVILAHLKFGYEHSEHGQ
jgi:DNA-binding GntR family transcriptional regulator